LTGNRLAGAGGAQKPLGRGRFRLMLLLICAVCGFALFRSTLFRLASLDVVGAERLTVERVREVAGLHPGVPRWERPAARVEALLAQEPWVASAEARWEWNRLTVKLQERTPVALIRYHDRFYLSLDSTGIILEMLDLAEGRGLPVISTDLELTRAVRGEQLTDPGLSDALTVLSAMSERLRQEISEVKVEPDRSLLLYMAEGATVRWGTLPDRAQVRNESVQRKVGALELFWFQEAVRRGKSCQIDLRIEGPLIASGCE